MQLFFNIIIEKQREIDCKIENLSKYINHSKLSIENWKTEFSEYTKYYEYFDYSVSKLSGSYCNK